MNAVHQVEFFKEATLADGNGHEFAVIEEVNSDMESLEEDQDSTRITATTIAKTLPSDVTLIVQNNAYSLEVLESYKNIISDEMRTILQREGHRSPNFRRYGEILRNITTAIKLKTDFIRDLFRKLIRTPPEELAKTAYATIVHYQKSLQDYQEIITYKQAKIAQEIKILRDVLTKLETTFVILRRRAKEISELISTVTDDELTSYPPQELDEFRAILESALNEDVQLQGQSKEIPRQALIKVLEAIGIQALSFKENRRYQEVLGDIEWHLGNDKAHFINTLLGRFAQDDPRELARKYDATIIKHTLFLLSHFILLLESQENVQLIERYNETSRRLSEALNIKLNPYKAQMGMRICDDLAGIYPDELAAYQTYERIVEYQKILEASLAASEGDDETAPDLLIRRKTLVKVLEAEGIQTLMWEDPEKHKKYQEILAQIEKYLISFKDEFLKERLERFSGLSAQVIAQKYRVNTIKHNVLLLARLSLLLNRQENVELMSDYYLVSKNIFEALNLKLEESKIPQTEPDAFQASARTVLAESDLFRTLSNTAIERIIEKFQLIKKEKDTTIIHKGQKGDAFYVVHKGSVNVSLPSKGGKEIQLAVLNVSDCFGEMSLLTGNPASATISALEDVELLKLTEEHFNDMLLDYPVLNRYFHRILSERLREASDQTPDGEIQKGLSGKLSTISLEELIQTLYTANKTGVLTIDNNGDKGKIFIKNGLVIHAMTKSLKGEQAFFRVMTWHDATFRFVPGEVSVERTVTMNVHGLLLEAMKRIDDMRQIKHL